MKQTIINLLENAIQHGGSTIQVSVARNNDNLIIKIEDDGIAINEEDKEKIFQAFTRLNDDYTTQPSGFGLGLAIVNTIVEHHHGKITVSNSPLGGACFTMIFPIISN